MAVETIGVTRGGTIEETIAGTTDFPLETKEEASVVTSAGMTEEVERASVVVAPPLSEETTVVTEVAAILEGAEVLPPETTVASEVKLLEVGEVEAAAVEVAGEEVEIGMRERSPILSRKTLP